jgi:hypothetical protein
VLTRGNPSLLRDAAGTDCAQPGVDRRIEAAIGAWGCAGSNVGVGPVRIAVHWVDWWTTPADHPRRWGAGQRARAEASGGDRLFCMLTERNFSLMHDLIG